MRVYNGRNVVYLILECDDGMRLSNRFMALLIVMAILVIVIPLVHAQTVGNISVVLPSKILEVGKTQRLSIYSAYGHEITDFTAYSFTSSDTDVAIVDENGNVTGVSIGRAKIYLSGAGNATVEVPVVGANLLEVPENSNIAWDKSKNSAKFWWLRKYMQNGNSTDYMSNSNKNGATVSRYEFAVETREGPLSDVDRVLRLTSKSVPSSSEGINRQYIALLSHNYILTGKNKMYEFSGWAAADNVPGAGDALHNSWKAKLLYYYAQGSTTPALKTTPTEANAVTPFLSESGNQPWTYFNTVPIVNDGLASSYNLYFQATIDGGKNVTDGGWQGDILLYGLSLHEVRYERLEFTDINLSDSVVLNQGESVDTVAKHFTNTGNEITTRLVNANEVSNDIAVTYKSSDENIATVSDDGVITAHAEGLTEITATATLGGVAQEGKITVAVDSESAQESAFGIQYAYICSRKNDAYTVTVFAATESLDYNRVGFEIIGSCETRTCADTTQVYRNVNVKYTTDGVENITSLTAENLGMSANGYIFFKSESVNAEYAQKGLIVRAYAEGEDGQRVYGSYTTLDDLVP